MAKPKKKVVKKTVKKKVVKKTVKKKDPHTTPTAGKVITAMWTDMTKKEKSMLEVIGNKSFSQQDHKKIDAFITAQKKLDKMRSDVIDSERKSRIGNAKKKAAAKKKSAIKKKTIKRRK